MLDMYKILWSYPGGRPWTYILRDTWHKFEGLWVIGLAAVGALLGHWLGDSFSRLLLAFSPGHIAGHLLRGTAYIPDWREDCDERG